MLTSLAYDGLVAYRRAEGVAGDDAGGRARHAAAAARARTAARTSSRCGTGLRYSDGRPGPARGLPRLDGAPDLRAAGDGFPPFFAGIVGAPACMRAAARAATCRAGSRPTIRHRHDHHPPHRARRGAPRTSSRCRSRTSCPPARPARRSRDLAPPGTGPYRFAAWDSRRGGQLVRNPHFLPTANRPAGLADRIDFKASMRGDGRGPQHRRRPSAARRTWCSSHRRSASHHEPAPRQGARRAARRGRCTASRRRARPGCSSTSGDAPFDDIRVRRAVNLATDRAALVELAGGPEIASPACQIVPTAFPGFEPDCPYTAHPSRGRGWTAPDLERARRLIAASGTAGEHVVVDVPTPQRHRLGRYFVSLLRELGFHARMRVIPFEPYFERIQTPAARAIQMGFVGWAADFLSPSSFIDGISRCTSVAGPDRRERRRSCATPA